MATDDQQVLVTGQASAPANFKIPGNGQIRPKAIFAAFDGTSAAGAFLPALKVISDAGETVGIYKAESSVAAGASADVSWFPRVGGGSSGATATPAASAYLTTFTPVTFTGSNTYTVAWPTFQTTDTSVFGTNNGFNANTPTHNTAGDIVLVLLKDGAYCLQTTLLWAAGTVNAYGGIQNTNSGYAPIGNPNATNDLATVAAPYTGNGRLLSQDTRLLTIPAGQAPAWFYLEAAGQTAVNYTMTSATFLATWFGSGIAADTVVYQVSQPLTAPMPPDLDLPDGYIVEWSAISPTTGADVAGVVVSGVSIFGTKLGTGDSGGGPIGPFMLVPGPGA